MLRVITMRLMLQRQRCGAVAATPPGAYRLQACIAFGVRRVAGDATGGRGGVPAVRWASAQAVSSALCCKGAYLALATVGASTSGIAELWWLMISHLPSRFSYTKV